MTAIFAYAKDDIAFVCGDTQRTSRCGNTLVACKVHRWSEYVLLAQAGEAQFLTDLLCRLIARISPASPSANDFLIQFQCVHERYWNLYKKYCENKHTNPVKGTVIVCSSANAGKPASLHEIDFETGTYTLISGDTHAHGSQPGTFQLLGARLLPSYTNSSGIEIDVWGIECVKQAITHASSVISFPVDLLISRPLASSRLIAKYRCLDSTYVHNSIFNC